MKNTFTLTKFWELDWGTEENELFLCQEGLDDILEFLGRPTVGHAEKIKIKIVPGKFPLKYGRVELGSEDIFLFSRLQKAIKVLGLQDGFDLEIEVIE